MFATIIIAVGSPRLANAQPVSSLAGDPEPPAQVRGRVWYGGQTLALDTAALFVALPLGGGVSAVELGSGQEYPIAGLALVGVGAAAHFFAAPILHASYGRGRTACISLGLRVLAPLAGAAIATAGSWMLSHLSGGDGWSGEFGVPLVGASVGTIAAITIDTVWLSWRDSNVERSKPPPTEARRPEITPQFAVVTGGLSIGAARRF